MAAGDPGRSVIDYVSTISAESTINNPEATEFTESWSKVDRVEGMMKTLEQKLAAQNDVNQELKDVNQELKDAYQELRLKTQHLDGWESEEAIRQRFLSCVKRDILREPTEQYYRHIRQGNLIAHHGNCLRDCHLYEAGGRTDFSAFEKIYGLPPSVIRLEVNGKFFPDS